VREGCRETSHQEHLKTLHADFKRRGFFDPSHHWKGQLLFWIPLFFASYVTLLLRPWGLWSLLAAPVSAVALLTMGFVGHDAGHYALSRKAWVNELGGQIAMTVLCGMTFGYWRVSHNAHHAHCQEIDGDPDMQFGVIFSVYPNSANWHTALGRFFLRIQKWAFWPLASFYWVSLRYDAIRNLFKYRRDTKIDRFLLPFHWGLLVVLPGFLVGWQATLTAYLLLSCLSSLMTASVFIPNHIGMRRVQGGEKLSYLEQQVTTSRNVSNHRWFDFYYGGLNSQIEHHLFPRVSHHRYRAMRPAVRALCLSSGISYHEASFYRALAAVSDHLGAMTAAYVAKRKQQAPSTTEASAAPSLAANTPSGR